MTRITCLVPFCRCTRKPTFDSDEEWICDRHYSAIPASLRREYDQAWHQAVKADQRAADGLEVPDSIYVRVTEAFRACKAAAIEAAGGI
ncbi:hypothetical protein AB4037_23050 [Labrys sp. KB_33_2]|uniref:hypothetical protein n=1 Tax=Labrys sp. KB_33_2 TaxID=3237479 RepID=UPI003F908624